MTLIPSLDDLFARKVRESQDLYEHMDCIRRYAGKCQSIVEFGVRQGCSTAALLAGKPKSLTSYDTEQFDEEKLFEEIARANGIDFRFVQNDDCAVEIEMADLLMIDTIHTYAQLDTELSKHACKVGRFIIAHDTYSLPSKSSPGNSGKDMWIAILKLLSYREWRIVDDFRNQHGLTILERVV